MYPECNFFYSSNIVCVDTDMGFNLMIKFGYKTLLKLLHKNFMIIRVTFHQLAKI